MKYLISVLGVATLFGLGFFLHYELNKGGDRGPASMGAPIVDVSTPLITLLTNPPTEPLHCVFLADGFPDSTIDFDPDDATVTTTTGNPPAQQVFTDVTVMTGLAPYGNDGLSVVAFGDVPLFHVALNGPDGNFPATWDGAPGGPTRILNAGVCTIPGNGDDDGDDDGNGNGGGGNHHHGPNCHHRREFHKRLGHRSDHDHDHDHDRDHDHDKDNGHDNDHDHDHDGLDKYDRSRHKIHN